MAKKAADSTVSSENLISDLIKDTEFKFISPDGEGSLSDKPKVETPLYALNDLLGGGLPLGSIIEVYGPNAAGKSSFMYETLGNFQKQYKDGVAFIIDSEASTDDSRLRALGVDPLRAPRMGASSLEDGFEQISKILKKMVDNPAYKGFPVMILWDTIAGCPSRSQLNTGEMYGGGMAEKARILKTSLTNMFPLIDKQNVLLVLLNQVSAEIGGWKPGLTSSGGHALKHDVHMRIMIEGGKTTYDGIYATEKISTLTLEKAKISPLMRDIPISIDITKGGVINRSRSLVWWMTQVNPAIFKQGSWWEVNEWAKTKYAPYWSRFTMFSGSFRQTKLYEVAEADQSFVDFLRLIWIDLISEKYSLQKEVCKDLRSKLEVSLMVNLGILEDELSSQEKIKPQEGLSAELVAGLEEVLQKS